MRPSDDAYAPLTAGMSAAQPGAPMPGDEPRRTRRGSRRQGAVVALLFGAIAFGACQGDNLWSPTSASLQPQIKSVATPGVASAGDTLPIQVSAYGARSIASVELSVVLASTGAAILDTAVTVTPAVNVVQPFNVLVPVYLADTALIVRATAHDKVGAISRMRADTVIADAPPVVLSYAGPDSIRAGVPVSLAVHAAGVRGVSKIRFMLHGAASRNDSILVSPPRTDVVDSIGFLFASTELADTTLLVDMQAVDRSGLGGSITRARIPVAMMAPLVDSLGAPATVTAGSVLYIGVKAHGLRPVTNINYRLSGAVVADQTVPVSLPGTIVTQNVNFNIPVDAQDSVRVSVRAIDAGGLMGIPREALVLIPTGAPVVDSLIIVQGGSVVPGGRLDARVYAHGSRQLSRIDLGLRQAFDADYSATPTPPRTTVAQDFAVTLPDSSKDSVLVVQAKATDAGGAVSQYFRVQLKVTDVSAPTVSATLLTSSVAAGRPAGVHVIARDNVGLSWVGARLLNASRVQVGGDSAAATGKMRDTTLNVVTPLGPPTTLTVVAFARDGGNREGKSPDLPLTVVDSTVPGVIINTPVDGMTFSLADSVPVTVHATSLIGVKSILLQGVAIRGDSLNSAVVVARFSPKTVTFPQPPSLSLPRDTTLTRYLAATADTTSEYVKIIATVTDSSGKQGTDTATISVGGPRVQILTPVNGAGAVGVGTPFQLRIMAKDKSIGVDSITALMTGVISDSIKWSNLGAIDSIMVQTQLTSPTAGSTTINVAAWNHNHIIGRAMPVTVTAAAGGASDQQRPSIAITSVTALSRTELTDPIQVAVHTEDNGTAGLVRFGIVAYIARPAGFAGTQVDTVALTTPVMAPRSGWIDTVFTFLPRAFGLSEPLTVLPASLSMRVTAFAVDAGNYCGATASAVADSITCQAVTISTTPGTFYLPQGASPTGMNLTLVGGRSVGLPDGGTIADAVIDNPHSQVYLSNIAANRVDVLRLADTTFVPSAGGVGLVGSQPWGLFLNGPGDTLFVANSGSTNISFLVVNGGANNLREDVGRRLLTPNEVLFEVTTTMSNGFVRYAGVYYDFSDRPQFVAQDAMGRVIYSTKPTGTAPDGTLRYVIPRAAPQILEPKLLFNSKAIDTKQSDITAIAFIDSMRVYSGGAGNDLVRLYDHTPGDPTALISNSTPLPLADAITYMQTNGSDIQAWAGKWLLDMIGMSDTTFMAAAGNRGKIAFGEGAAAPAGRIMVWDGTAPIGSESLSNDVAVSDLLNNASEQVFGLGLNSDGSLGVARGQSGAYFFTPDLRLQGMFSTPGGAGGAALHPLNAGPLDQTNAALGFVSTPTQTIKILDSVHFFQRGEIALRDNVVGPVKAALPLAGENGALAPTDPNYIIVKLYAVTGHTDASGYRTQVVIVNVRNKDLVN